MCSLFAVASRRPAVPFHYTSRLWAALGFRQPATGLNASFWVSLRLRRALCKIAPQALPRWMRAFGTLFIICSIENHKQPHHPAKVQGIYYLSANTCGRRLPFHYTTLQGYISFRHLSFHFAHCQPQPRQPTQKCLHSLHFAQASSSVTFRLTLAVQPTPRTSQPKCEAPCHPFPFRSMSFSRHLCFCQPCQRYALRYCLPRY